MPRAALLALLAAPAAAQAPASGPALIASFNEVQEQGALAPDELAQRLRDKGLADEAAAAETTLNDWKLCVQESLARWAPLGEGPGTLIDGAFGRCGDLERQYRNHLVRVPVAGRTLMDLNFARVMTRSLEEVWRLRLVALALDQALARKEGARDGRTGAR